MAPLPGDGAVFPSGSPPPAPSPAHAPRGATQPCAPQCCVCSDPHVHASAVFPAPSMHAPPCTRSPEQPPPPSPWPRAPAEMWGPRWGQGHMQTPPLAATRGAKAALPPRDAVAPGSVCQPRPWSCGRVGVPGAPQPGAGGSQWGSSATTGLSLVPARGPPPPPRCRMLFSTPVTGAAGCSPSVTLWMQAPS